MSKRKKNLSLHGLLQPHRNKQQIYKYTKFHWLMKFWMLNLSARKRCLRMIKQGKTL